MTNEEFFSSVRELSEYRWEERNGRIVGTVRNGRDRNKWFNPVTALARSKRVVNMGRDNSHGATSKKKTKVAANELGVSDSVVRAMFSDENRGYAQVVRGKIKQAIQEKN